MKNVDLSMLGSMRRIIKELAAPLDLELASPDETAQLEAYGRCRRKVQNGLEMIMGELTMVALLLTNVDLDVSTVELDIINDMRRAVYGDGVPLLNSHDYLELCREFLRLYPKRCLTIDHLPSCIKYLSNYDQAHDTEYARKACALFSRFAEAIVNADKVKDYRESIILLNFKEILYATPDATS